MALYSIDAEQSILGAILIEPKLITKCNEVNFSADDFFVPKHTIIFKSMKNLSDSSIEIDPVTLNCDLQKYDMLSKVGGMPYLIDLMTKVPAVDNIVYYMKIVKDFATKRMLKDLLSQTAKDIQTLDSKELLSFTNELKTSLLESDDIENLFIDASTISLQKQENGAIQTGFSSIDSATGGGLNFGTLTILTGNPGSGKSTFLNQILANALSLGFSALLYSGELTYQMMMEWFAKTVANPNHLSTYTNNFGRYVKVTSEGFDLISNWTKDKLFIYSKDARADEINLSSAIEYLAINKNTKLFILDNLMTLECSGSDKYEKQIIAVKALKNLAKKYNLVVILVAHSNKSSLLNREAHVFEISGASEIPNLADYVFKASRDNEQPITYIGILKNRITGIIKRKVTLTFDSKRKRFFTNSEHELKKDFGYNPVWEQESFY
ncbi:DnaB-like helicase N-terminal domain-containing protein [Intestinibacter sp.]